VSVAVCRVGGAGEVRGEGVHADVRRGEDSGGVRRRGCGAGGVVVGVAMAVVVVGLFARGLVVDVLAGMAVVVVMCMVMLREALVRGVVWRVAVVVVRVVVAVAVVVARLLERPGVRLEAGGGVCGRMELHRRRDGRRVHLGRSGCEAPTQRSHSVSKHMPAVPPPPPG